MLSATADLMTCLTQASSSLNTVTPAVRTYVDLNIEETHHKTKLQVVRQWLSGLKWGWLVLESAKYPFTPVRTSKLSI